MRILGLGLFGFASLSVWFFLSRDSDSVRLEIPFLIGGVAITDAASAFATGGHELREMKREVENKLKARIIITDTENN